MVRLLTAQGATSYLKGRLDAGRRAIRGSRTQDTALGLVNKSSMPIRRELGVYGIGEASICRVHDAEVECVSAK